MRKAERSRFSLRRLLRLRSSQALPASSLLHSACQSVLSGDGVQQAIDRSSRASHERTSASDSSETKVEVYESRVECRLCLGEYPYEAVPKLMTCPHYACYDCLQTYLRIEIFESRVPVSCPQCSESLHPNDIRMIVNDKDLYDKYEDFMVRRVLAVEPDARWCPAPDCSYAVIASGCASCPKIECMREGCGWSFCYHCKAAWHPNQTCDAARAQRSPNMRTSSLSFSQDSQHRDDIKPCPRCNILIVKMDDGSCNHMTCSMCAAEFCWLCMKEISDLHYLSPSGCTFWGKKPWSRKKKILWQLGTLVGAPVGIALLAGIAVPAIIIGIPVWVGRKLFTNYQLANKHKRNLIVTGGVLASTVVSPVLAGLAVSVGVPILLFYVYGVVPVSLCRSGGCGVTASPSGGVRLDFHSQPAQTSAPPPPAPSHPSQPHFDDSVSQLLNASIGEAGSLSGASGSASVADREQDRASAQALAGSIAHHRLEVEADVVSSQRLSVSSETESSVSERSSDQPSSLPLSHQNKVQGVTVSVGSIVEDLVLRNVNRKQAVVSTHSTIDEVGVPINAPESTARCQASSDSNCSRVGGFSEMSEVDEDRTVSLDSVCLHLPS